MAHIDDLPLGTYVVHRSQAQDRPGVGVVREHLGILDAQPCVLVGPAAGEGVGAVHAARDLALCPLGPLPDPATDPRVIYSHDAPQGRPMTIEQRARADHSAASYGRYMDHAESAWQPVIDAIAAEGVELGLWQTGGGCLALGIDAAGVEVMVTDLDGPILPDGPGAYVGEYAEYAQVLVGLSTHPEGLSYGEGVGLTLDARWDRPESWASVGRVLSTILVHMEGQPRTLDALLAALDLSGLRGDDVEVYRV